VAGQIVIRRSYKFRAYPNRGTRRRLCEMMWRAMPAWNWCVGERRRTLNQYAAKCREREVARAAELGRELDPREVKRLRKEVSKEIDWPSFYSQRPKFAVKRGHPEYEGAPSTVLEMAAYSADASWKSFIKLRQNGDPDARPPQTQYPHPALIFRQSGWKLSGDKLILAGAGTIPLVLHRGIEGKIKTVTITEKNQHWYVSFSCEIKDFPGACGPVPKPNPAELQALWQKYAPSGGDAPEKGGTRNHGHPIGRRRCGGDAPEKGQRLCVIHFLSQDLFLVTSDGHIVPHPGFYEQELDSLARLNQSLARKHKARGGPRESGNKDFIGSNRRKARLRLSRRHERIARKRDYWLWGLALLIARGYDEVVVYELPVKRMIQYALDNEQARKLCDGARGRFLSMLEMKCQWFGTKFTKEKGPEHAIETALAERIARYEQAKAFIFHARKAVKYDSKRAAREAIKHSQRLIEGKQHE
jgi:transposase